jgi:hypothetical protein
MMSNIQVLCFKISKQAFERKTSVSDKNTAPYELIEMLSSRTIKEDLNCLSPIVNGEKPVSFCHLAAT